MNYLKTIGLAAVAAMALMAVAAGSASATTLEIGGTAQSGAVTITASAEGSITLSDTEFAVFNTCSVSNVHGSTTVFSGTKVTGPLSELSFGTCTRSPVTVDKPGKLYIDWEGSGTSGSVFSEEAEWTVPTSFGFSVTCKTGAGTKIGTLDGRASSSEHATLTVAAVLSCGFLLPSASWSGSYIVTSPTGLGVRS
jgi:hypothetical protein